jgi:predicted membrane-bound dolichyl-phosphate-mannose-protein mannosyltransferase
MLSKFFSKRRFFFESHTPIIFLLFVSFFLRLALSSFGTLTLDQNTFIAWSTSLYQGGFGRFYQGWSDYLPGYLYILWVLSFLSHILPSFPTVILYKLPAIFSDIGTGYLIYLFVSKLKNRPWALFLSGLYLFNPAILSNSTLWGQVDSVPTFLFLLSIFFLPTHKSTSALLLAISTVTKPQAVLALPLYLYYMWKEKWRPSSIVSYIVIGGITTLVLFFPFSQHSNIFSFIYERLLATTGQYPYSTVNAFSLWGLWGQWKPDSSFTQILGLFLSFVVPLFVLFRVRHRKNYLYSALSVVFLSGFLFMTRMHERHLFPAFAPLLIAAGLYPPLLLSYILLSVTYVANMHYSFVWITDNFREVFTPFFMQLFVLCNISALAFAIVVLWKSFVTLPFSLAKRTLSLVRQFKPQKDSFPVFSISTKRSRLLLFGIIFFAFFTRIFSLSSPSQEYFDEVYHAFTARQMLHGDAKAWEWWNESPQGFAYEWTHPPFAKLAMVGGMLIFGENSFGWRIPAAVFGTATVFLLYLLTKTLFKDEPLALLTAAVFSLDGLPLALSRIGMNDSYFLFFTLLSLYLYIKDRNFLSSICLGLAAASKWSTMWALPIFPVLHFMLRKKIRLSYLWFFVIPPLVYLSTYIPLFTTGHDFSIFTGVQQQMWWYHTNLRATHPFTSPWYTWPFLYKPIWLYTSGEQAGYASNIYAQGNPIVFWFGVIAVCYCVWRVLLKKLPILFIVVFSYFVFFAPWALSPRIMFLYHYLPSVPFLSYLYRG